MLNEGIDHELLSRTGEIVASVGEEERDEGAVHVDVGEPEHLQGLSKRGGAGLAEAHAKHLPRCRKRSLTTPKRAEYQQRRRRVHDHSRQSSKRLVAATYEDGMSASAIDPHRSPIQIHG